MDGLYRSFVRFRSLWGTRKSSDIENILSIYRVTLVVEYLGWVDLDLWSSLAGGPLLWLPSAHPGWWNMPIKPTQPRYSTTRVTLYLGIGIGTGLSRRAEGSNLERRAIDKMHCRLQVHDDDDDGTLNLSLFHSQHLLKVFFCHSNICFSGLVSYLMLRYDCCLNAVFAFIIDCRRTFFDRLCTSCVAKKISEEVAAMH